MAGVSTLHPEYKKFAKKWKRCRDVCEGQDAVHAAGVEYLPKLTDQTPLAYKNYVMRTPLVNFSWRTIAAMLGLLSRKDAKTVVPAAVEPFLDDISQAGVPFNVFTQSVLEEVLTVGRLGVMVDHPAQVKTELPLSIAQAEKLGLRPVMQLYKTETIVNWAYRIINNKHVLAKVVLKEQIAVADPADEFCDTMAVQYRVLDLDAAAENTYRIRLYDPKISELIPQKTIVPLMNNAPLDSIPFYFIGVFGITTTIDEPPLIDLIDLNLSHYRTNADYEHACHFTGLPTPWMTGHIDRQGMSDGGPPEKVFIGSEAFIVLPEENAKLGYLEFTGQGLQALADNKSAKEAQMSMLGSRLLSADKSGVEAFQTVAIRNNGETSILASISLSVSLGIKTALGMVAQWAGATGAIEFQINRDFMSVTMDAPTLLALVAGVQAGLISKESFFDLLQRGDVIDQDLTYEEEQGRIDSSPPALPTPTTTPLTPRKPAAKPKPATVQ